MTALPSQMSSTVNLGDTSLQPFQGLCNSHIDAWSNEAAQVHWPIL